MDVKITPHKLKGEVLVPPSKSLSHRAIIAASLANGRSIIDNVILSEDIIATIDAMKGLGAQILVSGNRLIINGKKPERIRKVIDCHESGSTLRFMIPIALTVDSPIEFIGKNKLVKRPLDIYFDLFDSFNISYSHGADSLPLKVKNGLKSGVYKLRGDVSSQFITGLLFALPLLNGDSKIVITSALESIGYIDLTLDILKEFGIEIENHNYLEYIIKGNQEYKPHDYKVEGDFSQSAFFLLADMLGSDISLLNMNLNSSQGDKKILKDIESFGGKIIVNDNKIKATTDKIMGAHISFSQSPDLGPALSALASVAVTPSYFTECERLRIKECDRITDMITELKKLGVSASETASTMSFEGNSEIKGAILDSHNDHRVCMALAMLATIAKEPVTILNASCVKKSYPHFFEDFMSLGGIVEYVNA